MSTWGGPFSGLLEGMVRGQETAMRLHRQAQEDQAFKTNQALHNQQLSMQDIMNRQMLSENARPISAMGTIDNPAVEGSPNPLSGVAGMPQLPNDPGMPAFSRKADASRTVKYDGQSYELKTGEEQQQSALDRQVKGHNTLEEAKSRGDYDRAIAQRKQTILDEGGIPAAGMESLGYPAGFPLTRKEFGDAQEEMTKRRKANRLDVAANHTIFDDSGMGQAPGAPGEFGEKLSGGAPAPWEPRIIAQGVDTDGANRKSRETIAADNRTAADTRAENANKSREKTAGKRNAATVEAARIRRDNPTPGQAGVQNRFDARRLETDKKALAALEVKESELHAEKLRQGALPNKNDAEVGVTKQTLSGLDLRIKAVQAAKQKLISKWDTQGAGEPEAQQPGGRITVKLSDGREGDVDAAEFDPKTMTKL